MRPVIVIALFVLLALLMLFPSLQALQLELAKTNYFSPETMQAEISADFVLPLKEENIFFFSEGKRVFMPFKLEQISNNKYFFYAQLPETYGKHEISVRNVLVLEEGKTIVANASKNFFVSKPVALEYKKLLDEIKIKTWQSLSVEQNALALLALKEDAVAEQGKKALLEKKEQKSKICWPSPCNVKETALAIAALHALNNSMEDEKNWLPDAQNSFEIGLWDLVVNATSNGTCLIRVNNGEKNISLQAGMKIFSLSMPSTNAEISLQCAIATNAKISHTYKGIVNDFPMQKNNSLFRTKLSNEKCWGKFYRSECDEEATAYALLALHELGVEKSDALGWLEKNAKNIEQKAISTILGSDEFKEFLLNNQALEGYWPSVALAISQLPDAKATVFAFSAMQELEEELAMKKAEEFLLFRNMSSEERAIALWLAFSYEEIEPLLSLDKGIIKTFSNANISLALKNNGALPLNVKAKTEWEEKNMTIEKNASMIFFIPPIYNTTFSSLDIEHATKFGVSRNYKIPLVIFAIKKPEEKQEEKPANETVVPKEETPEEVIERTLSFVEEKIEEKAETGEKKEFYLTLKNPSKKSITARIEPSWSLYNIVSIEQENLSLAPSEEKKIKILVDASKAEIGSYYGSIDAKSEETTTSISFDLSIEEKEKTCFELEGKKCGEKEKCVGNLTIVMGEECCVGKCEKEKSSVWIFVVIVIVLIAALAILFFILKKKGRMSEEKGEERGERKEEIKKEDDEIEKILKEMGKEKIK